MGKTAKELIPMLDWLSENFDAYFERLSSCSEFLTVCHGDFTQGNCMIEKEK
jgi:hypothetical protein